MSVDRFKPAVSRRVLVALAGTTWLAVGVGLLVTSERWLVRAPRAEAAPAATAGLLAGGIIARLGFRRIARRNLFRLRGLADRSCVFAFQAWKSYVLIAVMVAMGVTLRHSALPRPVLAFVYAAMGGALLLGSGVYYSALRK